MGQKNEVPLLTGEGFISLKQCTNMLWGPSSFVFIWVLGVVSSADYRIIHYWHEECLTCTPPTWYGAL